MSSLKTDLFIDGAYSPAASGRRFATVNPATGETIAEVAEAGKADLDRAVASARKAFESGPWAARKPRQLWSWPSKSRGASSRRRNEGITGDAAMTVQGTRV